MRKASDDIWKLNSKYSLTPCYEMPYIDYKYQYIKGPNQKYDAKGYLLWFSFPEKAKFVTHFKDVDIHSLVGNIGGYIGLFLGKYYFL